MTKQQQSKPTPGPFDFYPWLRCEHCDYPFQHVTFNRNGPHPCPMCGGAGREQSHPTAIAKAEGRSS